MEDGLELAEEAFFAALVPVVPVCLARVSSRRGGYFS